MVVVLMADAWDQDPQQAREAEAELHRLNFFPVVHSAGGFQFLDGWHDDWSAPPPLADPIMPDASVSTAMAQNPAPPPALGVAVARHASHAGSACLSPPTLVRALHRPPSPPMAVGYRRVLHKTSCTRRRSTGRALGQVPRRIT